MTTRPSARNWVDDHQISHYTVSGPGNTGPCSIPVRRGCSRQMSTSRIPAPLHTPFPYSVRLLSLTTTGLAHCRDLVKNQAGMPNAPGHRAHPGRRAHPDRPFISAPTSHGSLSTPNKVTRCSLLRTRGRYIYPEGSLCLLCPLSSVTAFTIAYTRRSEMIPCNDSGLCRSYRIDRQCGISPLERRSRYRWSIQTSSKTATL